MRFNSRGDEAVDEASERAAHVGVEAVGAVERVARLHRVVAGDAERDVDRRRCAVASARARVVELLGVDAAAEQVAQLRRLAQRVDHRQRVDALEEVVARGLAERVVGGGEVEDVVDDLEAHAEVTAEAGERVERGVGDARRPCRRCGTTCANSAAVLPSIADG